MKYTNCRFHETHLPSSHYFIFVAITVKIIYIGVNPNLGQQDRGYNLMHAFQAAQSKRKRNNGQSGIFRYG